jgi:ryanodine receptor 2
MSYLPKPIDVAMVSLSPDLLRLTEELAQNGHELWAARRMAEGWSYGARRDDALKQHPCLVAYDELPETEKEYDRITAMGAIKAILKLGYSIHPPKT